VSEISQYSFVEAPCSPAATTDDRYSAQSPKKYAPFCLQSSANV